MVRRILLANLGTSDIKQGERGRWPEWDRLWNEPSPGKTQANIRAVGEFLAQAAPAEVKKLIGGRPGALIEILQAYVEELSPKDDDPVEAYFFGTDQVPASKYRNQDTYPLARALKTHRTLFFPPSWQVAKAWQLSGDPTDLASLRAAYRKFFSQHVALWEKTSEPLEVYVGSTGGTPQMTMMLAIESALALGSQHQLIYLYKPREGPVRKLPLNATFRPFEVNALLDAFAFHVVAEIYDREASHDPSKAQIIARLARYGHHRLNSNWQEAIGQLQAVLSMPHGLDPTQREQVGLWANYLQALTKEPNRWLLTEFLAQAEVVYRQGNFWSFLLRLVTTREVALNQLAVWLGVRLTSDHSALHREWLQANPWVEEMLQANQWDSRASVPVLLAIVRKLVPPEWEEFLKFLDALEEFQKQRNKVIHEGEPVDKAMLMELTRTVYTRLGADPPAVNQEEPVIALIRWFQRHANQVRAIPWHDAASSNPYLQLRDFIKELVAH